MKDHIQTLERLFEISSTTGLLICFALLSALYVAYRVFVKPLETNKNQDYEKFI